MTQAFSCRLLTVKVRVRSQSSRCGFCGGLCDIETGVSQSTSTSPCRRDLYMTTHNTHKLQASMPPVGFEPAIPASELPQTYALDRAASAVGPMDY
jgi:hypothetical protein